VPTLPQLPLPALPHRRSARRASGFVLVGCTSSCGVNNSPGFDTKSVVNRHSQTLPAANVAFCGLHRDMPEEKLDLLELAPRIMAKSCRGSAQIMWRKPWNVDARGSLFDNVPDGLL
jgi:hypothetical protein